MTNGYFKLQLQDSKIQEPEPTKIWGGRDTANLTSFILSFLLLQM